MEVELSYPFGPAQLGEGQGLRRAREQARDPTGAMGHAGAKR
jgi:hypothetical protein